MKRIVVFGTFDIFHPGHVYFLNQAKKLGDFLLVVVARDENVKKIKNKFPQNFEKKRAQFVRRAKIADKVILGSRINNYFNTVRSRKIDTIALGYDQKPSIRQLRAALKRHRLKDLNIIRLKPYNPNKYKSSKLTTDV